MLSSLSRLITGPVSFAIAKPASPLSGRVANSVIAIDAHQQRTASGIFRAVLGAGISHRQELYR